MSQIKAYRFKVQRRRIPGYL